MHELTKTGRPSALPPLTFSHEGRIASLFTLYIPLYISLVGLGVSIFQFCLWMIQGEWQPISLFTFVPLELRYTLLFDFLDFETMETILNCSLSGILLAGGLILFTCGNLVLFGIQRIRSTGRTHHKRC